MIEFLSTQILLGNVTLDRIPSCFQAAVQQRLLEIGGGDVIDKT